MPPPKTKQQYLYKQQSLAVPIERPSSPSTSDNDTKEEDGNRAAWSLTAHWIICQKRNRRTLISVVANRCIHYQPPIQNKERTTLDCLAIVVIYTPHALLASRCPLPKLLVVIVLLK